jgi:serine/threonine protein phosphatase PrpC
MPDGMPSVAQLAIAAFEENGGACGVTAIVYRGKLYTAGMGDCRVIAIWNKDEWQAECMFADHRVRGLGGEDAA